MGGPIRDYDDQQKFHIKLVPKHGTDQSFTCRPGVNSSRELSVSSLHTYRDWVENSAAHFS
jgi:hypothetical protein